MTRGRAHRYHSGVENKHALQSTSPGSQAWHLLLATRPRQWAKNLLIYLAFFFTLGKHGATGVTGELSLILDLTLGFLFFSFLTGATYIVNDLIDIENDRQHPRKRHRPLASGSLRPGVAVAGAVLLVISGIGLSFALNPQFGIVSLVYLGLMLGYTLGIKELVILDVLVISGGFVLRAVAGALILDVPISPWLYVMTSLGALLIALGKRRTELMTLGKDGALHRSVLNEYTIPFVDQLISVVAPATVVAYTLYTFTADNLPANHAMMLTIPFVIYGLFRYLLLVHRGDLGGAPEEIFLTDRPLLVNNLCWLATAAVILISYR